MQPPPHPVGPQPPGYSQAQPPYPYSHPQPPYPARPAPPGWPHFAFPPPVLVDGYQLVQPRLKPIPSGPAIGSLVAGIGGVLGAIPGLIAAGFSPWTGFTFFMFAALTGIGSVGLALYAKRQINAARGGVSGRGLATTGLVIGIVACSFAVITALIALAAS